MAAAAIPTTGIFNQPTLPSAPAGGGGLFGTSWYYNSSTGGVQEDATIGGILQDSLGTGWHGPFNSKDDALYFYTSNAAANPGWKAPAGFGANVTNALNASTGNAVPNTANAVSSTLGDLDAVPKFLSRLTSGNLWLRIAEGAAGLILLAIGINALFKGKPMKTVTSAAAKAAPLALM